MRYLIQVVLFCAVQSLQAQSPSWIWTQQAGDGNSEAGNAIATDANDNVYVAGNFRGSSIVFGTYTVTNANSGTHDVFLVKYDKLGNVIWAVGAGGSGDEDTGNSLAIDGNGNVYVTGYFTSSTLSAAGSTLINAGGEDAFTFKFNSSGVMVWAHAVGDVGHERGNGLDVDAGGNLYVVGQFESSLLTIGGFPLTNQGLGDAFLVRYNNSGLVDWAGSGGSDGYDAGTSIKVSSNSDVTLAGYFEGTTLSVAGFTLANTAPGFSDIVLARFDSMGSPLWIQSFGGSSYDTPWNLEVDGSGNCYLTGWFRSSLVLGTQTLTANGLNDILVLKCDNSGTPVWANSIGGNSQDEGLGIAVDSQGGVYITGFFESSSISLGSFVLSNPNSFGQIVVAKFSSGGLLNWVLGEGGTSFESGFGIAVNSSNEPYVTGWFASPNLALGTFTLSNNGSSGSTNFFIGKLGSCPGSALTVSASRTVICTGESTTLTVSGASTYTWAIGSGSSIVVNPTVTSSYQVTGTDPSGCPSMEVLTVLVSPCAGVESESQMALGPCPNPCKGSFGIQATAAGHLSIFDQGGKQVYKTEVDAGFNNINPGLEPGFYLLQLREEEVMRRGRLLIQ